MLYTARRLFHQLNNVVLTMSDKRDDFTSFFFPFVWAEQKLLKKKLFVWKRPNCRWVQTIREMTTEIWRSMPALDGGRWLRSAVAARFMKMTSASTFTAWRHIWRRTFLLNRFQVINLENGARDNKEERPSCVYWFPKISLMATWPVGNLIADIAANVHSLGN